jgi:ribosomal protein S18 acetylase RimI-like enzyme
MAWIGLALWFGASGLGSGGGGESRTWTSEALALPARSNLHGALRVRPMKRKDFDAVVQIWKLHYPNGGPSAHILAKFLKWLPTTLAPDSDGFLYVAQRNGAIVGIMSVYNYDPLFLEVGNAVTDLSVRKSGIASALLHALLTQAKMRWPRVEYATAIVHPTNTPSQMFFQKHGFRWINNKMIPVLGEKHRLYCMVLNSWSQPRPCYGRPQKTRTMS